MKKYQPTLFSTIGFLLVALFLVSMTKIKKEKYQFIGNRQYIYNTEGLCEQKLSYDAKNKLEKRVLYFYDCNGNKIRTEKYLSNDSLIAVYKYEYNSLNQKISSEKTNIVTSKKSNKRYLYNYLRQNNTTEYIANGKLVKKVRYAYNEFGDQTECVVYNSKNEPDKAYYIQNNYNEEGNLIRKSKRDKKGKLVKTNTYKLNNKAQISESVSIYYNGKRPNSKRIYTYDNLGRRTGFEKFISVDYKK